MEKLTKVTDSFEQVNKILEVLGTASDNDLDERILSDIEASNCQILSFGEANHFSTRGLHETISSLLPRLKAIGFTDAALELRVDHADELSEFAASGDIEELSMSICSPYYGGRNAYCKNRFQEDVYRADEELRLLPSYEQLLKSLRASGFGMTCIDVSQFAKGEPTDRDEFMAAEMRKLVSAGKKVLWVGGSRHTMVPRKARPSAAQLLLPMPVFRVTAFECNARIPGHWNKSMDTTMLETVLKRIDRPVYVGARHAKQLAALPAYSDLSPEELVEYGRWDALLFFPSISQYMISQAAYFHWIGRNREHGFDIDDWLMAESELLQDR